MTEAALLTPEMEAEVERVKALSGRQFLSVSQRAMIAAKFVRPRKKKEIRMSNVVAIKGTREAPKSQRSSMETLIISVDQVNQWKVPPFQRPVRVNAKVLGIAEEMKQSGCEITGIVTLGKVEKDPALYIVDGQHRIEAFRISGLNEIIADVRIVTFDTLADMAEEFVRLNTALVRMRPDDILRGLEPTSPALKAIRRDCSFVGYDNIRRGGASGPIVGMSAVVRCWCASASETPTGASGGASAAQMAASLDAESVENAIRFLLTANAAWGRDPEYYRLWSNLNLTVCMWLWRRLVSEPQRSVKRHITLNVAQFKQCLMSVSANRDYLDWLPGRVLSDRDRSPCYGRLRQIFVRRLMQESPDKKKPLMPQPAWAPR